MTFLALAALLATGAPAATPLDTTRSVLEATQKIVASDASHDRKLAELDRLLRTFLDTDLMGREALGPKNWERFSPPQQKEFLRLFEELFVRTYVQKLLLFERPDFAYDGEEKTAEGARVDTRILTPKDEFAVRYRMKDEGGRWKATDIQVEDLSLTKSLGRQLDQLLAKSPPEVVLERMRAKYGAPAEAK